MRQVSDELLIEAVRNSTCISQIVMNLDLPFNTIYTRYVREQIERLKLSTCHFGRKRKHTYVFRICPVCQTEFETPINHRDEKTTCSHKCANTYFRTGKNHPNYKDDVKYQTLCWRYHKKECIICGENRVVAAHHYNENHHDNRPENFVPLCPTHHQYWHSGYRHLIQDRVEQYVLNFQRHGE